MEEVKALLGHAHGKTKYCSSVNAVVHSLNQTKIDQKNQRNSCYCNGMSKELQMDNYVRSCRSAISLRVMRLGVTQIKFVHCI